MIQGNGPNRFILNFLACVAWRFWLGAQTSQGGRRWAKAVKLRGDWGGATRFLFFSRLRRSSPGASPLVPGRFALFCGSPLDSAPDKISILKFSPHVRGNPRQSWILGSTMWIPHIGTGFRISCQ